jgi:hypothetical protein
MNIRTLLHGNTEAESSRATLVLESPVLFAYHAMAKNSLEVQA